MSTKKDVNGSGKNGVSRRDFFKIGGLTSLALATATVIERVGESEIISSPDEYGGFYIRRHSKQNPPYKVDDTIYTQMDSSRGAGPLSNMLLVLSGNSKLSNTRAEHILHGRRGQDRLAYAFESGAGTFMMDTSFYSWEPVNNNILNDRDWPETRWDRVEAGYSQEEVTQIVKTAARFYGASLTGITALDERWFYSRVVGMPAGMSPGNLPPGGIDPTMTQQTSPGNLPPGDMDPQMLPILLNTMEPKQLKDLLLKAMNSMDPASLPAGITLQMLEAVDPGIFKNMMLPQLLQDMDPAMTQAIIQNLDSSLIADFSTPTPVAGQDMPLNEIVFSDEVDAPKIQDGKQIIPRSMNRIVVMAFEMDSEALSLEPGPLMLAGVGNAYSRMAFTAACMAKFIRALGYNAIPMGNDTALSMPMAVDAGLGEVGRNGLMITPKYGPRVRLAKVLTDLPLEIDGPITFGVTEFCEICGKCAKTCPSQSISHGERTYQSPETGNPGFYHWPVNGATCFMFWETVGTDCNICIASCPFNKPQGWLHDATKILIGVKSGPLDKLLLNLDDASGYGEIKSLDASWDVYLKKDQFIHIKP